MVAMVAAVDLAAREAAAVAVPVAVVIGPRVLVVRVEKQALPVREDPLAIGVKV